ncbi:hypothetical protein FRD82_23330 [Mycobacterium tuberculosis]|nr:hypothetical protein FRD82_23330 [Mycobacterium tuberculosis]
MGPAKRVTVDNALAEPAVATTLIGISAWWANGSVKQYAGDLTDRVATMTVCRRTPAPRVHYRQ